jgi:pilus assembly protein CpaB
MKNRTVSGILCIILSFGVMFGVSPFINRITSEKITVCQVNRKISQGQMITVDDIVKVEIGSYGVKEEVIKNEEQLVGKYAKSDIYPNINIYPEMISDKADSADDILKSLNGKQIAMSISISSLANGLSGKLKSGDIVSVIVIEGNESIIPAELTYVKVITATTSKGVDIDRINEDTGELPSTVTLLVNPEQAKLLAKYEQSGKIHLALVYRGDKETADRFLDAQNRIFTESEDKPNE